MDLKEAVQAAAPADDSADMPEDQAQRVVEGARHLSPHLGERMRAIQLFGRSIFIRELLPQDLKIELETLTREQAMNIARFLANVVGNAHARQMDEDTRSKWANELSRARTGDLKAPSWLWSSVVDLIAIHEKAYLEHCQLYARPISSRATAPIPYQSMTVESGQFSSYGLSGWRRLMDLLP